MAAIHTESAAIFGHVQVNAAEEKVQYVEYRPTFAVDGKSVVEFLIPGNTGQYVSLRDSYILTTVRIQKTKEPQWPTTSQSGGSSAGGGLDTSGFTTEQLEAFKKAREEEEAERKTSEFPLDAVFHTMWNGVDVFMNQQRVSTTNTMYTYKSYLETMLNNSINTKRYQLTSIGYTGEQGSGDHPTTEDLTVPQLKRKEMFEDGKSVQLLGYLASDMMTVEGAILPGVQIQIKLYPNKDKTRLMTTPEGTEAELIVEDIVLKVCKKTMTPEVVLAHAKALEEEPARYPFRRTEVRAFGVPAGYRTATVENPYQSNIPTRLLVGMVKTKSYAGDFSLNPLNFQHFNISSAGLYIDDEPIPKRPYKLAPAHGRYIEPFMDLYSVMGKAGEDRDIGISRENFVDGMFLIPFDTCPTAAGDLTYLSKYEGGHMRLELTFSEALEEPIHIITYAVFPALLEIDMARNVKVRELEKPQGRENIKSKALLGGATTAAAA